MCTHISANILFGFAPRMCIYVWTVIAFLGTLFQREVLCYTMNRCKLHKRSCAGIVSINTDNVKDVALNFFIV